jgi:hypothetical protein
MKIKVGIVEDDRGARETARLRGVYAAQRSPVRADDRRGTPRVLPTRRLQRGHHFLWDVSLTADTGTDEWVKSRITHCEHCPLINKKFFLDGDDRFPTICGTGTEDYFLGSWGFPQAYSTAYSGSVLPANENAEPPQFWSLYCWHIQDPIDFEQDLRVTIQALGWAPKYRQALRDHQRQPAGTSRPRPSGTNLGGLNSYPKRGKK